MAIKCTQIELAARPIGDPKHSDFRVVNLSSLPQSMLLVFDDQ